MVSDWELSKWLVSFTGKRPVLSFMPGLVPAEFVHMLRDAHVYKNHVEPLQEQQRIHPRLFLFYGSSLRRSILMTLQLIILNWLVINPTREFLWRWPVNKMCSCGHLACWMKNCVSTYKLSLWKFQTGEWFLNHVVCHMWSVYGNYSIQFQHTCVATILQMILPIIAAQLVQTISFHC